MKINRLLEITIILLNKGTITAKELSQRFGVSTRTIYRDVEELSTSGVPVYCNRGINGGISLLEDFSLNRTLLSSSEIEKVLFALKSLQTTNYPGVEDVLVKLGSIFKNDSNDWIEIDENPWGSSPNQQNKFTDIKKAVLNSNVISIDYINSNNESSHRMIYPLRLIYKGCCWYLSGFCSERKDLRLFRISRIKSVRVTDIRFNRTDYDSMEHQTTSLYQTGQTLQTIVTLQFSKEALYRLYDEYDDTMIQKNSDGTYLVTFPCNEDDWLYSYILSFGNYVEVISPQHIREIMKKKVEQMFQKYLK